MFVVLIIIYPLMCNVEIKIQSVTTTINTRNNLCLQNLSLGRECGDSQINSPLLLQSNQIRKHLHEYNHIEIYDCIHISF